MSPPVYLSVQEYLARILNWLKTEEPFFHTRYNDGEWISMFRLRKESQRCPRHQYTRDIGDALLSTHDDVVNSILAGQENILLGSNWLRGSSGADKFNGYVKNHPGLLEKAIWCAGDSWYTTGEEVKGDIDDKGLLPLIDEIREGNHEPIFVTNKQVCLARYCLNANWVSIPPTDGWPQHKKVLEDCLRVGKPNSTYIWSAGFPGKVLAWRAKKSRPGTSHIDLGSLFDCVFRVGVAAWMLRTGNNPHQSHRKFVSSVIEPYVRKFIPEGIKR